jgi:hypothetical protein
MLRRLLPISDVVVARNGTAVRADHRRRRSATLLLLLRITIWSARMVVVEARQ